MGNGTLRYRVSFLQNVPPRKVLIMEVVPLNRIKWLSTLVPPKKLVPPNRKMTKYTGPTQDTKDDRVFKNFSVGGDHFHT